MGYMRTITNNFGLMNLSKQTIHISGSGVTSICHLLGIYKELLNFKSDHPSVCLKQSIQIGVYTPNIGGVPYHQAALEHLMNIPINRNPLDMSVDHDLYPFSTWIYEQKSTIIEKLKKDYSDDYLLTKSIDIVQNYDTGNAEASASRVLYSYYLSHVLYDLKKRFRHLGIDVHLVAAKTYNIITEKDALQNTTLINEEKYKIVEADYSVLGFGHGTNRSCDVKDHSLLTAQNAVGIFNRLKLFHKQKESHSITVQIAGSGASAFDAICTLHKFISAYPTAKLKVSMQSKDAMLPRTRLYYALIPKTFDTTSVATELSREIKAMNISKNLNTLERDLLHIILRYMNQMKQLFGKDYNITLQDWTIQDIFSDREVCLITEIADAKQDTTDAKIIDQALKNNDISMLNKRQMKVAIEKTVLRNCFLAVAHSQKILTEAGLMPVCLSAYRNNFIFALRNIMETFMAFLQHPNVEFELEKYLRQDDQVAHPIYNLNIDAIYTAGKTVKKSDGIIKNMYDNGLITENFKPTIENISTIGLNKLYYNGVVLLVPDTVKAGRKIMRSIIKTWKGQADAKNADLKSLKKPLWVLYKDEQDTK